jgi:hypothetical protein
VVFARALNEAWLWLFANWAPSLLGFVITSGVTLYVTVQSASVGEANTYLLGLISAVVGAGLTLLTVFAAKLIMVPVDIHVELEEQLLEQKNAIKRAEERRAPKLEVISLDFVGGVNAPGYYLNVKNLSDEVRIPGCKARIEELRGPAGTRALHWDLRAENQPQEQFDLEAGQAKRILLCTRSQTAGMPFRLEGVPNKEKLPSGHYELKIRIFTGIAGPPIDVLVVITGAEIRLGNEPTRV